MKDLPTWINFIIVFSVWAVSVIIVLRLFFAITRKNAIQDHNTFLYEKYLYDNKARQKPSLDLETLLNGQAEAAISAADDLDDQTREHHKKFKS